MEINYKITEIGKAEFEKYKWLNSNFDLRDIGERDDREIVRLLENPHYPHIKSILERIDNYGALSDEIGEQLLSCNDILGFDRLLAELNIFIYLYKKIGKKIKPIRRKEGKQTADFSITYDDIECIAEIYTPMDYFGYQSFSTLLTSCIKNTSVSIGFDLTINSNTENLFFTREFPSFRDVYNWISGFQNDFSEWIMGAEDGEKHEFKSPIESLSLIIQLNSIETDPDARSISWSEGTRSTDTICFFRIKDPDQFSKTQWGIKIKDKMSKSQAGQPKDKKLRILFVNMSRSDTTDLSFICDDNYYNNFSKHIEYLAKDIVPNPPYDLIFLCQLGFECGFSKPVKLSGHSDDLINDFISKNYLNIPVKKIPTATKEETKEFFKQLRNAIDEGN